jgi:Family of unknown function (DUF6152)
MSSVRSILAASCLAAAVAVGVGPAFAHHSFGHYAMDKTSEIQGVVSKWEWSNPHCWLFVDVTGADGKVVTYGFELQSVGELLRRGWKRNSVKVGDKIKVAFRPMKDGAPAGLMVRTTDASGKVIGTPAPPPPPATPAAAGAAPPG